MHQVDVIEQVDTTFVTTNTFTQVQSGNFDSPMLFRPILLYSGISPSFSLDYTTRIYNTENSYQIIKTASVTSFNPSKYGKNLERIALSNVTSPLVAYNKVYGGASINYSSPLPNTNFNTVYVPVFYDSKTLFTGQTSVLAPGQDPLDPHFNSNSIYFAQGAARLYLGDFDQYVKFSFQQYVSRTNSLNYVDLSAMTIFIGFNDSSGKLFTYPALPSTIDNPLGMGDVVFLIPAEARKKIGLDGTNISSFYILANATGNTQAKLYIGSVDFESNLSNEQARVQALGSQAVTIQSLTAAGASSTSSSAGTVPPAQSSSPSILTQLGSISNAAVPGASASNQVLPPTVPGFTSDPNAAGISSIAPTGT